MPFVTNTTSQIHSHNLKVRTDYAAYVLTKQSVQTNGPVKSVSGMTTFTEILEGDVYTKLDDLNFILAKHSPDTAVLPTAPTQPIFNTTNPITSTGFTVNWSGGSGADSYTYTLDGTSTTPSSSTTQSATFTGLSASTTYSVIVTAVNSIGSAVSSPLSVTTLIPPPTLPILTATTSITSSGFTVNWSGATGATSYMYTLDMSAATPSSFTATSATFTGLSANTTYSAMVTAVNIGGSTSSSRADITTLIAAPTQPTFNATTSITSSGFTVNWSGGSGAASYTYTLNGSAATPSSSTAQSATFTGLSASTAYSVIVTAVNSTGSSVSSPLSVTTLIPPPTQPIFSATTAITSSGFTVNWSGGTGASSYTYTLGGSAATPSSSTAQSATFTGLSASTAYSVIVTAVNSTGSTSSVSLSVTTLILPPTQPIFNTTTSITSSAFTVNWTGGTGATSYTYTLGGSAATPSSSTTQSATFTGLTSSTAYSVIVTAVNDGGSTSSSQLGVTTLIPAPTQPSLSLQTGSTSPSGFTVNWSGGSGADSYTYTLNGSAATPSSSTATSATFTSLAANTAYSVIVTAVNTTGSTPSSSLSVTTLIAAPTQPTDISGSNITSSGFTVNWTGGTGATSYTYTLNGSAATPSSSTASSATFTGRAAGTTYSVIVTAVNSTGSVVSTALSVTTLISPPTQPTFNPSTSITSTGFTVNWSGGTGATSYTYTLNGSAATPSSSTASSATFTSLAANTAYSVIVTAVNTGGNTSSSSLSVSTYPSNALVSLRASSYSGSGTWNDESGNGKNATKAYGTIAKNTDGNGIILNGSSAWTFANISAGNSWTMSIWYKQTANTAAYPMVAGQLTEPYNMLLSYDPTQKYAFAFFNTSWRKGKEFNITMNTWTYMVGTWNGTNLITYVNGSVISLGTTTPGGTAAGSGSIYSIGRDTNGHFAIGQIGEVTIFNTPLSASQISQMYANSRGTYGV
jgi:hypothetical protein